MTIQEFLKSVTSSLQQAGVLTARLDTLVLLEDALEQERAWILAHQETAIPPSIEVELNTKITQRIKHIPLAYILGTVEFYGRRFFVNKHVLVPRPETETMIDLLKTIMRKDPSFVHEGAPSAQITIVDVGTGSGAIAITAKLEFPNANVAATDIDPEALKIARQNATRLGARIKLTRGDLLESLAPNLYHTTSMLLANLPYVPEGYAINQAAMHEPKHAIFGGKDGLSLYRRFWEQISGLPEGPSFVLTESLPLQHPVMSSLAQKTGYKLYASQGFIQAFEKV